MSAPLKTSLAEDKVTMPFHLIIRGKALSDLQMMRADAVTPSHENEIYHDGYDIDALHNTQQKVAAKNAIVQQHYTGDEPDQPGYNANSPCASLNKQMMYLRGRNLLRERP